MHYERAIALRADNFDARLNLAQLMSAEGLSRDAAAAFRDALALHPDHPQAMAGLAWILATASDPSLQSPDKAVELAERAAALTNQQDLSVLDALAAAYASAGKFDEALAVVDRGIKTATESHLDGAAAQLRGRRDLYQQHRPYRQSKFL